ncbi:hypothetical protein SAMN05421833_14150 [Microbispora rosea]|uniref:Uncharacterized protein n=1 Tax=Microbispora rosea TaxID=58117 RepID=A0A1N7HAJ2_9ACTN|nr:hypothetical protein SAMN05421833_14150 [Microbispora rosea]
MQQFTKLILKIEQRESAAKHSSMRSDVKWNDSDFDIIAFTDNVYNMSQLTRHDSGIFAYPNMSAYNGLIEYEFLLRRRLAFI